MDTCICMTPSAESWSSPDQERLLQQDVPAGRNRLFDRALSGWEGTGPTVNSRGLEFISSFRQMDSVPWILASNIPIDEAFIPSRKAATMLTIIIVCLSVMGGSMFLLLLRGITTPLSAFTNHLQNLGSHEGKERLFLEHKHMSHEIEVLTHNFNQMIFNEDEQRKKLADKAAQLEEKTAELLRQIELGKQNELELKKLSARYLQSTLLMQNICDNVPDLIWAKDLENRYIFTNKTNNETLLFPHSPDEPIGKTHDYFINRIRAEHEDTEHLYEFGPMCEHSDALTLETCQPMQFLEQGGVFGESLCLDVYKAPLFDADGCLMGSVGSARIVTREKQLEKEAARLSRLHWLRSKINQKIAHEVPPQELFRHICDLLMLDPGCALAFACRITADTKAVPVAAKGISAAEIHLIAEEIPGIAQQKTHVTDLDQADLSSHLPPALVKLHNLVPFSAIGVFPIQPQRAEHAVLAIASNSSDSLILHSNEQQLIDELVDDLAFALDMAHQHEIQQQTLQELKLAATVFANSIEAIMVTDAARRIISINQAFCDITGYSEAEALGQTPALVKSDRHQQSFYDLMWQELERNGRWQGEVWNRRKTGQIYPASLSIACVHDNNGAISNYIGIFSDISQIKESEQQLYYLQCHDPLSDLPNRRMFSEMLTQAIHVAQKNHTCLALLCLDLDHFKDINDSYGFLAGDSILQQMGQRLYNNVSHNDKIARLGADEFIVLLEGVNNQEEVALVAEQLLEMMEEPFELETGERIQINTSIGVALYPEHGETSLELLQKVDSALYLSKQRGRNRFSFYNEKTTAKAVARLELGNHLRHALENGELRIQYQPQVNIQNGKIIGAEALMRWENPKLGMVPPDRFIPLAEQLGCIIQMGEWIIRSVCKQGKAWLDSGMPPITLAVNLSAVQFYQDGIVDVVQRILQQTQFPPELLELEVTESLLMHKERETIARLQELHELGVRLAMDDFGTGYSSLSYLKFFPLDVLKIDKSFVDDLPHDPADRKMVAAISQMGRGLGLTLLAEGVENQEQLDYLRSIGCTMYQGYFCSKPLSEDEFIALLTLNTQGCKT